MSETTDTILDKAKDKNYEAVVVVGWQKNGGIKMHTSIKSVPFMHWMLNKSIFDMNMFDVINENADKDKKQKKPPK